MEFRPKVRWWWTGGDVEIEELIREINILADNGFGGADIQSFGIGLDPAVKKEINRPVKSYGSEFFYKKLDTTLAKANGRGLIIYSHT